MRKYLYVKWESKSKGRDDNAGNVTVNESPTEETKEGEERGEELKTNDKLKEKSMGESKGLRGGKTTKRKGENGTHTANGIGYY